METPTERKTHFSLALRRVLESVRRREIRMVIPPLGDLYNPACAGHFHSGFEVFLPQSGTSEFTCPGRTFRLNPGQLAVVPPGVSHAEKVIGPPDQFETIVLGLASDSVHFLLCDAVERRVRMKTADRYSQTQSSDAVALLKLVTAAYQREGGRASDYWISLVQALLLRCDEVLNKGTLNTSEQGGTISWIRNFIRVNLSRSDLRVSLIARELGLHPDYLSRMFARQCGENLVDYIIRQRIEMAQSLLGTMSDMNVSEVAYACGFNHPSYFNRVFKTRTGKTPTDYVSSLI